MKKKLLWVFSALLFVGLFLGISNKPAEVQAATLQKTTIPSRFRGTWYLATSKKKVKKYHITKTNINLDGMDNPRVYKYTAKAYRSVKLSTPKKVLIKVKKNKLTYYYIGGRIYPVTLSSNHKTLSDKSSMHTYYRSKSAALKHYKKLG